MIIKKTVWVDTNCSTVNFPTLVAAIDNAVVNRIHGIIERRETNLEYSASDAQVVRKFIKENAYDIYDECLGVLEDIQAGKED